jgi:anti-sigma regulatory factor (Ser/Thr protein kinase)
MKEAPTLWVFAGELGTPRRARALVREWCAKARLSDPVAERLLLAANELVTNAVLHAEGGVVLTLLVESEVVVVEVGDRDPGDLRRPERPPSLATEGRGLLIVDALARSWGVRAAGGGKTVWARIPL